MKERPIIMQPSMVNGILQNKKFQTRRLLRNPSLYGKTNEEIIANCPYGKTGDTLWVRENFRAVGACLDEWVSVLYQADEKMLDRPYYHRIRLGLNYFMPSIHMPRVFARIILEIKEIRFERLQDITEVDSLDEGIFCLSKDGGLTYRYGIPGLPGKDNYGWPWGEWTLSARAAYEKLINQINGPHTWSDNPWVWVITFKRIMP